MKTIILSTCVAFAVALIGLSPSTVANPLSLTINLGESNDFAISDHHSRKEGTILEVLKSDRRFSRVVRALEENRGLRDDLEKDRRMTFLAPTDEAWKHVEEVLESMRNRNRRRVDESDRKEGRGDEDRRNMEEVLRYHIIRDEVCVKDMFNGQLLTSELREKELGDKNQRIRVFDFFGQIYLNMYARVHREELDASNGKILILDHILCPPLDANEMMSKVPFEFSTFIVAAEKVDMLRTIEDESKLTIFAPTNHAWKSIGIQNLVYLFSPRGTKDLKKVIQYHIAKEVIYSTNVMKEQKLRAKTLLHGEELEISACERKGGRSRELKEKRDEDPSDYVFTVNKGEARIQEHCVDLLAENGVVQAINAVLIPSDVRLPFSMN